MSAESQARKDITIEVRPKGANDSEYIHGDDNYAVTSTHLFTRRQRALNRMLGL